jgi:hypothetical protein
MKSKHAYDLPAASRMPSEAELETALRRARLERAEMVHALFTRAFAWIVRQAKKAEVRPGPGGFRPAA